MKINHVAVFSENFSKTIQFYKTFFPYCEVKEDEDDTEAPIVVSLGTDCWIALFQGEKNNFDHIAFEVSTHDYTIILQNLDTYHMKYTRENHTFPHECESLYFKSPDWYEIEVFCKELW